MSDVAAGVLLSIVIPAYNYAQTLPRTVDSVVPQLAGDCELIIIDDGSTDNTSQVIADLLQKYPGKISTERKANGGAASVRNRGIEIARGDWLVFLDADDEMAEGAIKRIREHLKDNPQTRFVAGGHISVNPSGKCSAHSPGVMPEKPIMRVRAYLLDKTLALSNGACVMHREVFLRGDYPEAFRSAEDIPVFTQVLANYPCSVLNEPLALIHKHSDSLRHQFSHARVGGLKLVDEVFSPQRMPGEFQVLRRAFFVQRCLSLFRSAWLAGESQLAKEWFLQALKADWRVVFRGSYSRKALRLWLSGK
ncbi:MAG TPA: glycosyltransferase family 2 protein [Gammaproteobacteria bacterium]|nr:glycosyl transferase [Pseudomonadales bacterium]MCK5532148.1 glycosyltransferase family 2 protein [Halopseudomonas aestusnigri]HAG46847.1 glycosyltransferase family 2 protein [Gammaproteobacteria bacterium]